MGNLKVVYDQFILNNDWDGMKPSTLNNLSKNIPVEIKEVVGSNDKDHVINYVFGNQAGSGRYNGETQQSFHVPMIFVKDMWEEMTSFYGPYSQMMDAKRVMSPFENAESRNNTLDKYFALKKPSKEIVEKFIWLYQHVNRDSLIQFDNLLSDYLFSKDVIEKIRQDLSKIPAQPINYGRDHMQQSLDQYEALLTSMDNITDGRPLAGEEIEKDFMRAAGGNDPIFFRSLLEHYTFKPELLRSGLVKLIERTHANGTGLVIIQLLANSNLLTKFDLNQTLMQTIYATTYNIPGSSVNYDMINVLRPQLLPKNVIKIQFIMDAQRGNLSLLVGAWNNPDISMSVKHVALNEAIRMKQVEVLREFAADSELQNLIDQNLVQFVKSVGDEFDVLSSKEPRLTDILKILVSASTKKAIGNLHYVKKTPEVSKILEDYQFKPDESLEKDHSKMPNDQQKTSNDRTPGSDGKEFYNGNGWAGALYWGMPFFLNPDQENYDDHSMQSHTDGNDFGPYANGYRSPQNLNVSFANGGGSPKLEINSSLKRYVSSLVQKMILFNRSHPESMIMDTKSYLQFSAAADLPSFWDVDKVLILYDANFRYVFDQYRHILSQLQIPQKPLPPTKLNDDLDQKMSVTENKVEENVPIKREQKPRLEYRFVGETDEQKVKAVHDMMNFIAEWNKLVAQGEASVLEIYGDVPGIEAIDQTKIEGTTSAASVARVLANRWEGVMPRTFDSWIQLNLPAELKKEIGSDNFADAWTYVVGQPTSRKYLTANDRISAYRKLQDAIRDWNELVKLGPDAVRKKYPNVVLISHIETIDIDGATNAYLVAKTLGTAWTALPPKVLSDWIDTDRVPKVIVQEIGSKEHSAIWSDVIGKKTIRKYLTDDSKIEAYRKMKQMIRDWNTLVEKGEDDVLAKYGEVKDIQLILDLTITRPMDAIMVEGILKGLWNGVTPGTLQMWIAGTKAKLPPQIIKEVGSSKSGDIWTDVLGTKSKQVFRTDGEMLKAYYEMQLSIIDWNQLVSSGKAAVFEKYWDVPDLTSIWDTKIEGPYTAVKVSKALGKKWNGVQTGTFQTWITKKKLPNKLVSTVGTDERSKIWEYTLAVPPVELNQNQALASSSVEAVNVTGQTEIKKTITVENPTAKQVVENKNDEGIFSQSEIDKRKADLSKNFHHYSHLFLPNLEDEDKASPPINPKSDQRQYRNADGLKAPTFKEIVSGTQPEKTGVGTWGNTSKTKPVVNVSSKTLDVDVGGKTVAAHVKTFQAGVEEIALEETTEAKDAKLASKKETLLSLEQELSQTQSGRSQLVSYLVSVQMRAKQEMTHGMVQEFPKFLLGSTLAQLWIASTDPKVPAQDFLSWLSSIPQEFFRNAQFALGNTVGTTAFDLLMPMVKGKLMQEYVDVTAERVMVEAGRGTLLQSLRNKTTAYEFARGQVGMFVATLLNVLFEPNLTMKQKMEETAKTQVSFLLSDMLIRNVVIPGITASETAAEVLNGIRMTEVSDPMVGAVIFAATLVTQNKIETYMTEQIENAKVQKHLGDALVTWVQTKDETSFNKVQTNLSLYWNTMVSRDIQKIVQKYELEQDQADQRGEAKIGMKDIFSAVTGPVGIANLVTKANVKGLELTVGERGFPRVDQPTYGQSNANRFANYLQDVNATEKAILRTIEPIHFKAVTMLTNSQQAQETARVRCASDVKTCVNQSPGVISQAMGYQNRWLQEGGTILRSAADVSPLTYLQNFSLLPKMITAQEYVKLVLALAKMAPEDQRSKLITMLAGILQQQVHAYPTQEQFALASTRYAEAHYESQTKPYLQESMIDAENGSSSQLGLRDAPMLMVVPQNATPQQMQQQVFETLIKLATIQAWTHASGHQLIQALLDYEKKAQTTGGQAQKNRMNQSRAAILQGMKQSGDKWYYLQDHTEKNAHTFDHELLLEVGQELPTQRLQTTPYVHYLYTVPVQTKLLQQYQQYVR